MDRGGIPYGVIWTDRSGVYVLKGKERVKLTGWAEVRKTFKDAQKVKDAMRDVKEEVCLRVRGEIMGSIVIKN